MYTYCKTYTEFKAGLTADISWLEYHIGPRGSYYLFDDQRWGCGYNPDSRTVDFTFKHSDDYTLFVLSCGDQVNAAV